LQTAQSSYAEHLNWGPCEGRIEGAHWIKRQAVRLDFGGYYKTVGEGEGSGCCRYDPDLLWLAEWDPRNGVPACERHHGQFDGRLVDAAVPFVVHRPFVPNHVEEFVADYGLETRLEQKCPELPPEWADV
jgi:hypothetical protein